MQLLKKANSFKILLIFVLLLSAGGLVFWKTQSKNDPKPTDTNSVSPLTHQALTQADQWLNVARPLSSADLKDRIILVDFWTYCCINCLHVIPDLKALEKEFGNALTVIGVHSAKFENEKDQENIRAAVLRHGIKHPVVNDQHFKIWDTFGVQAWPTLVLINPKGEIVEYLSGEGHREKLRNKIAQLVEQYRSKINQEPLPLKVESKDLVKNHLKFPGKLAYAADKEWLFISDSGHHRILVTDLQGKVLFEIGQKALPGNQDGAFSKARFHSPQGLLYLNEKLYVADTENHLLRKIDFQSKQVSTVAGTGQQGRAVPKAKQAALQTPLSSPWDLALYPQAHSDKNQNNMVIAMAGSHQLWLFNPNTEELSILAGNGRESIDDGVFPQNSLSQPSGLASYQDKVYFVDAETSSLRVLENKEIKTLVGTGLFDFGFQDGFKDQAKMQHPLGVWADASGVYISDSYNHAIRHFDPETKKLTTLLGDGRAGFPLNEPNDILRVGDYFWIADTNHHQIKKINLSFRP